MTQLHAAEEALNAGPKLAREWAARGPAAIKRVEELLASAGMTMDNEVAQAATHELDKLERFNRLIEAGAEAETGGTKPSAPVSNNPVIAADATSAKSVRTEEAA